MNCIDFINERYLVALFPILDIEARNALKVLNVGGDKHHLVMNRRCTYKQIKLIHTHTFMFKRVTNLAVLLERRIRGYNSEQFLYLLYIFQLLCLVIGLGKTELPSVYRTRRLNIFAAKHIGIILSRHIAAPVARKRSKNILGLRRCAHSLFHRLDKFGDQIQLVFIRQSAKHVHIDICYSY